MRRFQDGVGGDNHLYIHLVVVVMQFSWKWKLGMPGDGIDGHRRGNKKIQDEKGNE